MTPHASCSANSTSRAASAVRSEVRGQRAEVRGQGQRLTGLSIIEPLFCGYLANWGAGEVSCIEKVSFQGKNNHIWDLAACKCPSYRYFSGVLEIGIILNVYLAF